MQRFLSVAEYCRRAFELASSTNRPLGLGMVALSVFTALLPAAAAYVSKRIIDSVIVASTTTANADRWTAVTWVAIELLLVTCLLGAQRGLAVCESLLRAQLGQRVVEQVLEKALTLRLSDFEDPALYDRMTRARQEAPYRPLNLVRGTLRLAQSSLTVLGCVALLSGFSYWMLPLLLGAALPAFVMEARFSTDAFRLFRRHSPDARRRNYIETVLGRDDHAKEVQLFGLGRMLLERHRAIYRKLYREDRALTLKRGLWGFGLGVLSSAVLYASYVWIVSDAIESRISLGELTMYLLLFKQAQGAMTAALAAAVGLFNDNLYLSTLYEFLAHPTERADGHQVTGTDPADGLRLENVGFTYAGENHPSLSNITLHIPPGTRLALVGPNGSGKTTLVKLLTGLYRPSSGRILLDGRDLREWDEQALRRRIGVIFQDFVRYQMHVGENIGIGDASALESEPRWHTAAGKANADGFIRRLPEGYSTQLGRWFADGHELSLGEWQKIALARAFMRSEADIWVLDEPTASMDAEAEARLLQGFRDLTAGRTAIIISHRFSTVRVADRIVVLDEGRLREEGSHAELLDKRGRYTELFGF